MLRHGADRREARKAEHGCIFGIHADDRPAELRRRQIDDDTASDAFGPLRCTDHRNGARLKERP